MSQRLFGCLLAVLWLQCAFARVHVDAHTCHPVFLHHVENQWVIEQSHTAPQLYLIRNISNHWVSIHHRLLTPFGLHQTSSNVLAPNRWAAIAINQPRFHLSCMHTAPGIELALDCSNVLSLCQAPGAGFNTSNAGTYWLAQNLNFQPLLARIQSRHIRLPAQLKAAV